MTKFGEQLRKFRQHSNDQMSPHGRLTQIRLGELLEQEVGAAYSGAAVSDWERGVTKIHMDQRTILVGLIKILYQQGGIKTLLEANQFLESGNYRALDADEARKIFPVDPDPELIKPQAETPKSGLVVAVEELFSITHAELHALTAETQLGPKPVWPRVLAALMRKVTDRFSLSFTTLWWVGVWLVAWWLISPSLQLPFPDQNALISAMQYFVIGSLIVPLLIGLLVNTRDNEYWKNQPGVSSWLLRLYTYQGAGIGFGLGYFFVFPFSLAGYYLQLGSSPWLGIFAATAGLILGNLGARVVPHNLWLAYSRLTWSDGAIFFAPAFLGPIWSFLFIEFHSMLLNPLTGIVIIFSALAMTIWISARQSKRSTQT